MTNVDQFMTQRLEIADASGRVVLTLTKPRAFIRPRVVVTRADGLEVGQIPVKLRIGKARFALLDPAGNELGSLNAENWRAWDFSIKDAAGNQVGRVTKKWAGIGKELFTTADNYMIQIQPGLRDPLRSLAVASALAIDAVLKQGK